MSKPFDMELFLAGVLTGLTRNPATPCTAGENHPG
jgi:hypothetical protein